MSEHEHDQGDVAGTGLSRRRLESLGLGSLSRLTPELARELVERRQALADEHGLSVLEVTYCERERIDLEEFAAYKGARTLDDYYAARDRIAARRAARAEAERRRLVTEELERGA